MFSVYDSTIGGVCVSILLLSLVCCAAWVFYARTFHPLAKYPGPFLASISRVWIGWRVWKGDADVVERELHRRYGKFVRIAPDEVSIADPAAIRTIYSVNAGFTKTDFYLPWRAAFSRFPDAFTQLDEKEHAERARIVTHLYSMSSVVQSEKYIESCVRLFMEKMQKVASSGQPVNIAKWIHWYTFDVIGELYFSSMFGFLEKEDDHARWIWAVDTLLPVFGAISVMPTWMRTLMLIGSLAIPNAGGAAKAISTIANASETCVAERLEQVNQKKDLRDDILQRMMDIHKEKGQTVDFQMIDIQVEVYVALVAGSDTTMIAISSTLYHLLKTPAAYVKLQKEIDEANQQGQLSSLVKYSEASRLPYLGACIKEGLRLHPSAALTFPRHVPKGGRTICEEYFPEGIRVGVNPAVIHRDELYFGNDPDLFRPERWLEAGSETAERHFFTFGAGPRTCTGKNISFCEMYKLIPQLLRDYQLELAHGPDWKWTTMNHWFNKPKELPIRMSRRTTD